MLLDLPSVREEVDFNIRVPGPAVFPGRQVFGAQDGDDQLMTDFVVPEFDLRGQSRARSETLVQVWQGKAAGWGSVAGNDD